MKNSLLLLFVFNSIFLNGCQTLVQKQSFNYTKNNLQRVTKVSQYQRENWQHLDYDQDTILGVSTYRAYDLAKDLKIKDTIIVAVIDSDTDIYHEDLKNNIWVNKEEIPNNHIDDDKNGYVDDVHGWNFLSSAKGTTMIFSLMESTRILQKFKEFNVTTPKDTTTHNYQLYKAAKKSHNETLNNVLEKIEKLKTDKQKKQEYEHLLKTRFSDSLLTLEKLAIYKEKDTTLSKQINFLEKLLKKKKTITSIDDEIKRHEKSIEICLNLELDNRDVIVGDNSDNINDIDYGSPVLSSAIDKLSHGTSVSGVVGADRNNTIGVNGIARNVKVMPILNTAIGDYTDKDMALAIRYAVDNGARVINISQGKSFSLHKKWVDKAMKYAEKNNVLIVSSAGNGNLNLDLEENLRYPNDTDINGKELFDNFIIVGASSHYPTSKIKRSSSNYGKETVDIFAPGGRIKVLRPNNEYATKSGTSFASPVVAGVAALVLSYYPELTAKELKEIILASGISFDLDVDIKDSDKTIPFMELSKSGKIVNAYNALLMAKQVSERN